MCINKQRISLVSIGNKTRIFDREKVFPRSKFYCSKNTVDGIFSSEAIIYNVVSSFRAPSSSPRYQRRGVQEGS